MTPEDQQIIRDTCEYDSLNDLQGWLEMCVLERHLNQEERSALQAKCSYWFHRAYWKGQLECSDKIINLDDVSLGERNLLPMENNSGHGA